MESWPVTMTSKVPRARATPPCRGLPEDIVVWEILVRLPPKTLLRCRAVCRAWRRATMTHDFLHAHHGCQPSLPIIGGSEYHGPRRRNILSFDHGADGARLQQVARLDGSLRLEASCDGLLILSNRSRTGTCFSVCNPATLQHVALEQLTGFDLLEMYPHHSTGEYRLLLRAILAGQNGCYVYSLGSNKPPRYIGNLENRLSGPYLNKPALVRDSLHWSTVQYYRERKTLAVFDTTFESFRQMCAPDVPASPYVFEKDGTLGIYCYTDANDMQIVAIWVLLNYESEDWRYKYRVELPIMEINERIGLLNESWYGTVHSVDGDIILLVNRGGWIFHVDTHGKLVEHFRRDGQHVYACQLWLKQSLVSYTFFTALEGHDVNASPFV